MHSKRPPTGPVATNAPNPRAAELRAYLDRLVGHLDDSSLRAALKLMIAEAGGAVRRQQELIALERLDGRDTAGRIDQLGALELARDQLDEFCSRHVTIADDHRAPATRPSAASFSSRGAATLRTRDSDEVHVGRISAAALDGELACAEPPAACHRQDGYGTGAVR
jgi:hypothetical protein